MKDFDAERVGLDYGYHTTVFYKVHTKVASFKHTTQLGGYVKTVLAVLWHKTKLATKHS